MLNANATGWWQLAFTHSTWQLAFKSIHLKSLDAWLDCAASYSAAGGVPETPAPSDAATEASAAALATSPPALATTPPAGLAMRALRAMSFSGRGGGGGASPARMPGGGVPVDSAATPPASKRASALRAPVPPSVSSGIYVRRAVPEPHAHSLPDSPVCGDAASWEEHANHGSRWLGMDASQASVLVAAQRVRRALDAGVAGGDLNSCFVFQLAISASRKSGDTPRLRSLTDFLRFIRCVPREHPFHFVVVDLFQRVGPCGSSGRL